MENYTYGVNVANRYLLFIDEDKDPLEILKEQEEANKLKPKKDEKKTSKGKSSSSEPDKSSKSAKAKGIKNVATTTIDSENKPAKSRQTDASTNKDKDNRPRAPRQDRGVKFGGSQIDNLSAEERRNRRNRDDRDVKGDQERSFPQTGEFSVSGSERQHPDGGGRGAPRGRGGFRGRGSRGRGRGGFGYENRGKREFDRQSGSDKTSGVKSIDKREGGGSHNWGSTKDEIDEQISAVEQDTQEWRQQQTEEAAGHPEGDESKETVEGDESQLEPAEPEVKELTLDEWKALQEQQRFRTEYNLRKPGEGEDNAQWKKTFMLKRPEKTEEESDEEEEEDAHHGRAKQKVNIDITFNDPIRRGGRGGGGRGGPRGGSRGFGRGRGARPDRGGAAAGGGGGGGGGGVGIGMGASGGPPARGGRTPEKPAYKVDDESDFPSLGK